MEAYRPNERNELLEARHSLMARFHTANHKLEQAERIAAARPTKPSRLVEVLRVERDRLGWEIEDVDTRLSQLTNEPKEQPMSEPDEVPQVSLDLDVALAVFGAAKLTHEAMKEGGQEGHSHMREAGLALDAPMAQFTAALAKGIAATGPGAAIVDLVRQMAEAAGAPMPKDPPDPEREAEKVRRPVPDGQEQRSPKAAQVVERALETDANPDEGLLGKTDCPELCEVEPDGKCPHGYLSAGRTAGVV